MAELDAITQQINDPRFVAAYHQALQTIARGARTIQPSQVLGPLYQQFGIQLPHDYTIGTGADGRLEVKKQDFYDRNSDWIPPAVIGGLFGGAALSGAGAAGAAGGSEAAGAGGGATAGGAEAGTLASTTIGSGYVPAITGGTGIGGGAAAGGGILGALGKYGAMAGDVGQVASGAAGGMASGRRDDAQINGRAIAENNAAKVASANYNLNLPSVRTNQVARGEVMNTMQDAPMTGDPRIDKFAGGGLRPSAFGPQSRQAGAELSRTALTNLMDPSQDRLTPQEIPETHASTPENIAAGIGIGGNILSLLQKYGGVR